jgi:hypothetical protein
MKAWPIWLLIGIVSGCAATDPIVLPAWNIEPASVEAQQPLALPALPELGAEGSPAVLNREGVVALLAYVEVAEANTTIASENANALAAQSSAYNQLIEAGQFTVEISRIREDQLARERSDHAADNWYHRAIIALGLALAL